MTTFPTKYLKTHLLRPQKAQNSSTEIKPRKIVNKHSNIIKEPLSEKTGFMKHFTRFVQGLRLLL